MVRSHEGCSDTDERGNCMNVMKFMPHIWQCTPWPWWITRLSIVHVVDVNVRIVRIVYGCLSLTSEHRHFSDYRHICTWCKLLFLDFTPISIFQFRFRFFFLLVLNRGDDKRLEWRWFGRCHFCFQWTCAIRFIRNIFLYLMNWMNKQMTCR